VGWLEDNGHADAAASLREGLEETLTVLKLGLPPRLRRFFATTNAIENLIGTLRHVARNVFAVEDSCCTLMPHKCPGHRLRCTPGIAFRGPRFGGERARVGVPRARHRPR
jgi:hypothetical protein